MKKREGKEEGKKGERGRKSERREKEGEQATGRVLVSVCRCGLRN